MFGLDVLVSAAAVPQRGFCSTGVPFSIMLRENHVLFTVTAPRGIYNSRKRSRRKTGLPARTLILSGFLAKPRTPASRGPKDFEP